jgi:hypothetical protein
VARRRRPVARRRKSEIAVSRPLRPLRHRYYLKLQYRIRCNRFPIRAEQTQSHRRPCRRGAFSRRVAAASCCDRNQSLVSCLTPGVQSKPVKIKYRRFTMEKAGQLQCKVLRGREKSGGRKNNGYQWKTGRITMEAMKKYRGGGPSGGNAARTMLPSEPSVCRIRG